MRKSELQCLLSPHIPDDRSVHNRMPAGLVKLMVLVILLLQTVGSNGIPFGTAISMGLWRKCQISAGFQEKLKIIM